MAKNKQLREILFALSTDQERDEYLRNEKLDEVSSVTKEIKDKITSDTSNEAIISALKDLSAQVARLKFTPTDNSPVVKAIEAMTTKLASSNKPQDMSGFFKDLGVQLAQYGSSSKNTEELIRNLKWNSSMSIRSNSSGAPISPAVSPFQITDYDDIKLTNYSGSNPQTVTYYLGGGKIATLTITYDGSGNITEVKRT